MRVLVAVLLVGIAGCGGSSPSGGVSVPTPKSSQAKTDKSPAQTADANPVAALKKIGAKIKRNGLGEVVEVIFTDTLTDAELVHLAGLTNLQTLTLHSTKITDAGVAHLKGLAKLQTLNLVLTKITDAGLVHLKGGGGVGSVLGRLGPHECMSPPPGSLGCPGHRP